MKKIMFVVLLGVFSSTLFGQNEKNKDESDSEEGVEVPEVVENAFKKEFHGIKNVSWDQENGEYEAEFKLNGSDASATYDKTGHKKEVEIAIVKKEIPANILVYIEEKYPDYFFTNAAKITNDKGVIIYEAEIGKVDTFYDVLFDSAGNFIKMVEGD
ncbi:MAG: PepSY-like domain-containing protein [Bacteroidetes bacterium]|nr:PepSY-like domain-containing protein [Bacteroidota bacterium]